MIIHKLWFIIHEPFIVSHQRQRAISNLENYLSLVWIFHSSYKFVILSHFLHGLFYFVNLKLANQNTAFDDQWNRRIFTQLGRILIFHLPWHRIYLLCHWKVFWNNFGQWETRKGWLITYESWIWLIKTDLSFFLDTIITPFIVKIPAALSLKVFKKVQTIWLARIFDQWDKRIWKQPYLNQQH